MWETNICYCPGFPEEHHRSRWLKNSCYFAVELTLTTEQEEPGFGQLPAPNTQLPLSFKLIQISLVFLSKALLLRYTLFSMKWVTEGLLNLLTFSLCTYCKSSRFEISKASINKNSLIPSCSAGNKSSTASFIPLKLRTCNLKLRREKSTYSYSELTHRFKKEPDGLKKKTLASSHHQ